MDNLFTKLDSQKQPAREGNTLWYFNKKQRDKKLRKLKKDNGVDKFGNCLNGGVPIEHCGHNNQIIKWLEI